MPDAWTMKNGRAVLWMLAIGLVALVVAGVIALAYYVPKAFQAGRQILAEEQQRSGVLSGWKSPVGTLSSDAWFPPRLGDWERTSLEERAVWPDFPPDFTGTAALYRNGDRTIRILVFPVRTLEAEALEKRLTDARGSGGGVHTTLVTPSRMLFERSRPAGRLEVWRPAGWWILFEDAQTTGPFGGLPEAFFGRTPGGG